MLLDRELAAAKQAAETRMDELHKLFRDESERIVSDYRCEFDQIVSRHHKTRCVHCDGTGATERLDAAIMRRFQLKDWVGCTVCGGDKDTRGGGYV